MSMTVHVPAGILYPPIRLATAVHSAGENAGDGAVGQSYCYKLERLSTLTQGGTQAECLQHYTVQQRVLLCNVVR